MCGQVFAPPRAEDYAIEPQRDTFKGLPEGADGATCFEYCDEAEAEIFAVFDVREALGAGPSLLEDFPSRIAAEIFIASQLAPVEQACAKCGGTDVAKDAWARWNCASQAWELGEAFNFAFCLTCLAKTTLVQRKLEPAS
jgi:hypothetical protein